MLAAFPCTTAACEVHAVVGFVIVAGWFAMWASGLIAFFVHREPGRWFWTLLAVLQVLLGVQLVAGIVLLATGHRPDTWRHYVYGVIGPVIVLVIAHVLGRDMANEEDTWKVFAAASFVVFGLTAMAVATGLQIA
jgi:cytochrome c biogenesis protein CcdA